MISFTLFFSVSFFVYFFKHFGSWHPFPSVYCCLCCVQFPFDCQDLSVIIEERTTSGVSCVFLPELRKPKFGSIDPRYSVIDEWDLETAVLEFGGVSTHTHCIKRTA